MEKENFRGATQLPLTQEEEEETSQYEHEDHLQNATSASTDFTDTKNDSS